MSHWYLKFRSTPVYYCLVEASLPGDKALRGSVTLLTVRNCHFWTLTFIFLLYFLCVITYKCDLFGLCKDGFWRIFLAFSVLIQIPTILKTIWLQRSGRYRRVMEWGWRIAHCLIICSLMTYVGGRTKSTGKSRVLRRFSGIQAGWCALLLGCTVTCPRVLWQYGYVQTVPRHPTDVVELRPPQIVQAFLDFRTHTLKEPDWGEPEGEETWRMRDGYVLWYTRVSHSQILPPLPGDLPRPANEG